VKHHHAEQPLSPEDFADTRLTEGDTLEFKYNGQQIVGCVQRSLGAHNLIIASDGEAYLQDTRKDTIKLLTDHDLCVHCGHFICEPDCPIRNQQRTENMRDQPLVTLGEIIAMPPGYINNTFQAVVVVETKFDPASGEKYHKAKLHQSTDHRISIAAKFWGDVDLPALNGKLVEFSGSGLQRTEYKPAKSPRPIQQVSISDKMRDGTPCNNFRVIGESAHSEKPLPHEAAGTPDNGRDAPDRQQMANTGVPQESDEPVEDRVETWFRVFGVVCQVAGKDPKEMVGQFSSTDLKEITTGTIMSFKAAYGMHAAPHFRGGSTQKELDAMPSKSWDAEPVSTWKDVKHPSTGVELGKMDMKTALKLSRWALTTQPKASEKVFHGAVLMMAASQRFDTPKACLSMSLVSHDLYEAEKGFNDSHVKDYFEVALGGSLKDADEGQVLDLLKDLDGTIKGIMEKTKEEEIPY